MRVLLLALFLASAFIGHAQELDCNIFNDPTFGDTLIDGNTVPYPNTEHCDGNGLIRLVCNHYELVAFVDGYFLVVGDADVEVYFEVYMVAGQELSYSIPDGVDWLHFWYGQDLIGHIDIVEQKCSHDDTIYPPDNRINWQQLDAFFAVYIQDGYLAVYSTLSGYGELILFTQEPACSEDGSACLYLLEDGVYQLNLIDFEGKKAEIVVEGLADGN